VRPQSRKKYSPKQRTQPTAYISQVWGTKYGYAIRATPMTIGLYRTILLPYMNAPRPTTPNGPESRSAAGLENTVGRNGVQLG